MHFEQIINRISPKLRGITHRLNGRFTFFNEDDLYQEAVLRLWLNYRNGALSNKTDSYILQGCYFHLKNYIRKTQDKARLISMHASADSEGSPELEQVLSLEDPKAYFEDINGKILVEEILHSSLTEREKEVLSFCLNGLTTREIGEILGVSHVSVVKLRNSIKLKCQKYRNYV